MKDSEKYAVLTATLKAGVNYITELNLTRKPLGSVGACLLAEILKQTQIQDLHFAGSGIGEEGVVALANALSR